MKKLIIGFLAIFLLMTSVLAFAPIKVESREQVYEIPKGTWAERMKGRDLNILPATIRLVLGVKDILVLKNLDEVPQMFGPTLIMPDQSFKLPFETAAEYLFMCTAHVSGELTIVVEEEPTPGLPRLKYRLKELFRKS